MPRGPSRSGAVEADRGVDTILLDGDRVRGARHCARGGADEREEFSSTIFGDAAPTVLADMAAEETRNRFATRVSGRASHKGCG
jgi:all-trans-retinol 13,14-reductase